MTDEKKPRPSSQPAADSFGADDASQFTPVTDVLELLDAEIVLTERERRMFFYLWKHSANQELRARKRSDSQDSSILARRVDDLERWRVDMVGLQGNNGKAGALRADVNKALDRADAAPRFVKRAIVMAAGAIVGSLVTAILYIRTAIDKASEARATAAAETATIRAELEAAKQDRAFLHQQLDSMLRLGRRAPSSTSTGESSP